MIDLVCKDGDVKFEKNNFGNPRIAKMFVNGAFHPICGHYFWNNRHGANLFCRKMGYESGILSKRKVPNSRNAVQVGVCKEGDVDVANCTGGFCNTLELGGMCFNATCKAGVNAAVVIECKGNSEKTNSCNCKFFVKNKDILVMLSQN